MAIINQETQSQFASKTNKGGVTTNIKYTTNYDNTLISTVGSGEVISQVNPLDPSILSPKPGATSDQSYTKQTFDQSLR